MARGDRIGKRQTRDQRAPKRIPEMGYYLVVTDTEATERCYFNGLHDSLPADMKTKLVIKVVETKTRNLIEKCKELTAYQAQYRIPWIVFDRDQVQDFDQIIDTAEKEGIHVGLPSSSSVLSEPPTSRGRPISFPSAVTCSPRVPSPPSQASTAWLAASVRSSSM